MVGVTKLNEYSLMVLRLHLRTFRSFSEEERKVHDVRQEHRELVVYLGVTVNKHNFLELDVKLNGKPMEFF